MAENNAEILIKLGKLIKKKRDADIQKRVDKIADSAISNEEKIKHIEKLDKIAEQTQKQKSKQKRKKAIDKTKEIVDKGKKIIDKISKPAKELTTKTQKKEPTGFFHFFFKERNKIKHFGVATKTLSPGFLALSFSFTKKAKNVLTKQIWDAIYSLIQPMKYILREGWKRLNKFEYNLAVYFLAFCEEFYKTDFRRVKPAELKEHKRIVELEQLLLNATQDKTHRQHLLNAIEIMIKEHEVFKKNKNEIMQNARVIIEPDYIKPSLMNIFFAANMAGLRKFIKYQDLLSILNIKPIPQEKFHCTEKIKAKISTFINELKRRLKKLEKELFIITTLKEKYLQGYEENKVNYNILKKIFSLRTENETRPSKNVKFEDYSQDMVSFMHRLISNFFYVFDPLFSDSVLVSINDEIKNVKILPQNVISNVVHYVKLYTERLNRFILRHLNTKIYFEDFREYLNTGKTPYENELEFFRLISESSDSLFELGKTVTHMLQDSKESKGIENAGNITPYSDKRVYDLPGFEDLCVNDYLNILADFCFKYCHFYSNSKQRIMLDTEMRIRNEIAGIMNTLKRIG